MRIGKTIIVVLVVFLSLSGGAACALGANFIPEEFDIPLLDLSEFHRMQIGQDLKLNPGERPILPGGLDFNLGNGLSFKSEIIYREREISRPPVDVVNPLWMSPANPSIPRIEGTAFAAMGNFQYEFLPKTSLAPYVFGGIGPANPRRNDGKSSFGKNVQEYEWALAYQLGAGFGYSIADELSIGVSYRHLLIEEIDYRNILGIAPDYDYRAKHFRLGLTYHY